MDGHVVLGPPWAASILAGAVLLQTGGMAMALTGPQGTAELGSRGVSSIPSPEQGKVKVEQGFCRGLTGPSAFYRLFKQLTSTNQSWGAGEAGGACWEAGERRAQCRWGAAGSEGTSGAEDKGNHLPSSHKHHPQL